MKEAKTTAPIVRTFNEYLPAPFIDGMPDADGTYYGWAPMGTNEDEEGWRIAKIVVENSVTKTLYAQGTMDFISAWSERANYSYSR